MRPHLRGVTPSTLLASAQKGPLRSSALLSALAVADLEVLLAGARWVRLTRGGNLALSGSLPGQCWLLLDGYVKEHRPLEDGSQALCGFRGPGDLVAEMSALTTSPCGNDVTALGDGEALALPANHVRAVAAARPSVQAAFLHAVASRAASTESTLVRNHVGSTTRRVALALLDLADRWGTRSTSGVHISIPITQHELAEWVGTSRETVAKSLQHLRRDGLVETSRRHILVQDPRGLRQAAGLGTDLTLAISA